MAATIWRAAGTSTSGGPFQAAPLRASPNRPPSLPGHIGLMSAFPVFQSAIIPVVNPCSNTPSAYREHRMLVDLHVEMTRVILIDPLVFARSNPEQGEVAIRRAMLEPTPHESVVVCQPEPDVRRRRQHGCEFVAECIVDQLIGIQERDPRTLYTLASKKPVALLRESTVSAEDEVRSAVALRDKAGGQ